MTPTREAGKLTHIFTPSSASSPDTSISSGSHRSSPPNFLLLILSLPQVLQAFSRNLRASLAENQTDSRADRRSQIFILLPFFPLYPVPQTHPQLCSRGAVMGVFSLFAHIPQNKAGHGEHIAFLPHALLSPLAWLIPIPNCQHPKSKDTFRWTSQ